MKKSNSYQDITKEDFLEQIKEGAKEALLDIFAAYPEIYEQFCSQNIKQFIKLDKKEME